MKNLFYCVYNGIVRQGRFIDLYIDGDWHELSTNKIMCGILSRGLTCKGADYYQLAGINGTFCASMLNSPRKAYATLEDCRNDVNGIDIAKYGFEVAKDILSKGIEFKVNNTNFIPEVCMMNDYHGNECFSIQLPYWVWNGVSARKHYFTHIRYHILSKTLDIVPCSGVYELRDAMRIYGTLYSTEKECVEDNVVKVVMFSDEEC